MIESTVQWAVHAASASRGSFDTGALVFGGLLVLGALISGLVRRSLLSLTALFVLAGFALGEGGAGLISFNPRGDFVKDVAIVALIVILFRDGLEVESEMLQREWHLPLRKLVLAMPLTAGLVALAARALTDLNWNECFLIGALLSPTDPVLSSGVVTNPRVPRLVRHSLNLESGLNDGLALPAVLAFSAALHIGDSHFVWWKFVLQDVPLGLVFGVATGLIAAWLMPRGRNLRENIAPHQQSLYALGVAFAAYGLAVATPEGNGFIAVYVCAITLGIRRPDISRSFEQRSQELIEVVKLAIFVVFGSLLTLHGLFGDGWAAVGIVAFTLLIARPASVLLALVGTRVDVPTKLFMGWFGPKGVATMTFALLVLADQIASGVRIFDIAALAVFVSIIAHGLSDTAGSDWIARRAEREAAGRRSEDPDGPMPA
jgi:sodium/hydrogen antiporter